MAKLSARTKTLLLALYFVSGAVGLLDEVAFFKYLSLAFGATAYASSAVLVAFMAGLTLGAAAAAKLDARTRRPLRAYAALEIVVGLACAASPWLFAGVTRAYVAAAGAVSSLPLLEVLRAGLAAAVVLLPTMAMGATLPLVARIAGTRVTRLYAANTAGGAVGALGAAYLVIPALGLAGSVRAGACASVAVGIAAMAMARGETGAATGTASGTEAEAEAGTGTATATGAETATMTEAQTGAETAAEAVGGRLLLASAASGMLVFASEVVFVHLLALVDGTSVYVFGLVLCVFLVALSIGAVVSRPMQRRLGDDALGVSLALSGLALAATVPVWDRLPDVFIAAGPSVTSWAGREAVRGLVGALAIGLPAVCMGTTFPLVLGAIGHRADRGAQTGRVTAVNTVASIAGSLGAGFVLLPVAGSQRALGLLAAAYGVCALVVCGRRAARLRVVGGLAAATFAAVVLVPRWDLVRLGSGANVYFARQPEQGTVAWMNEDVHGGVVTVTVAPNGLHTMWTNGKYQGDDGPQMSAQRGFADIPAMHVHHFGRALLVGLGTGATLGALAGYPFEHVDVAELSPGIVEATRRFYGVTSAGALDDPRVSLVQEDGRNLLLVTPQRYDLITIELTSIWFAGAANLYSREFYALAASRLTDGGILSQWIQLHHTTLREIASQMATARAEFPHAAFYVRGDQGILVASKAPLEPRPKTRADVDDRVLDGPALDAFVADACAAAGTTPGAVLSTDDNLRLEYVTPRNNVPGRTSIVETTATLRAWAARLPGS